MLQAVRFVADVEISLPMQAVRFVAERGYALLPQYTFDAASGACQLTLTLTLTLLLTPALALALPLARRARHQRARHQAALRGHAAAARHTGLHGAG